MSIKRLAVAAIAFVVVGLSGCGDRGVKRLPLTGFKVAFESHKVGAQQGGGSKTPGNFEIKRKFSTDYCREPAVDG